MRLDAPAWQTTAGPAIIIALNRFFFMQRTLLSRLIVFLPMLVCAFGAMAVWAVQPQLPAYKIRTFFSGNVHAELGPCG